ncbi:MAG: AI-2E family transporter, partial [Calditrichia bacterium]|nr:AI-2E family transporter [Calditrichia bacterium]
VEYISIFVLLFLFFVVVNVLGYILMEAIKNVAAGLPGYEEKLKVFIESISIKYNFSGDLFEKLGLNGKANWNLEKTLGEMSLTSAIVNILKAVFNVISKTFLVVIYMLFILMGRGSLIPKLRKVVHDKRVERFDRIIKNITTQIQRYIVAKTIISLITGFLAGLVFYGFNVDFALVWIILTVLLNFIPSIGSILATIFPVTIAFLSTGTLFPALPVLIFLGMIQVVVGSIIDPRIMGDIMNVSPLAILISLIFWGWLWGILGMFLSVPIIVSIKIICENFGRLHVIAVLLSGNPEKAKT